MKHTVSLILILCMLLALSSCSLFHKHEYGEWTTFRNATCTTEGTKQRTCSCGEKERLPIEPLGHSWQEATCTSPKKCARCGKTEGISLGHNWQAATCASPKKCTRCGRTEGSKLTTHSLQQGYCSICGNFVNELPEVVDNLKELFGNCNYNLMYCGQVLNISGDLSKAVTYYNAYVQSLKEINTIFNKYSKEFVKLRNLITEITNQQHNYIDQYNASSITSTKRSLLSSAVKAYTSKEWDISSILSKDYTKP